MNKHLTRAELGKFAETGSFADLLLAPSKPHPGAPFNKRQEGRERRAVRLARIAEKRAFLDS